jgi:tetratricopeptide (TPR) repeat protein
MKRIAAILFVAMLALAARAQTNDPQALVQRGREAIAHGEPEKAVEFFEKAVALKPNNAEYHYRLANADLQAGMRAGMFGDCRCYQKRRQSSSRPSSSIRT